MRSALVRSDQVKGLFRLVGEAREIGALKARRAHLVAGIGQLVGAPFVTALVDQDFGPGRRGAVVDYEASYEDSSVRRMFEAMAVHGTRLNPGARALMDRVGARRRGEVVTYARRELLVDGAWYRNDFVMEHQRRCGLDDFVYSAEVRGPGRIHAITVTRARTDRAFTDEEANLVELFHAEYVRLVAPPAEPTAGPRLAPREHEVLRHLLAGATERATAASLGISRDTVHGYVKAIYQAYGVSSRAELILRCLGAGDSRPRG